LEPNGRLDMQTLAALGLLPGQQSPGYRRRDERFRQPPPRVYTPEGEPIYEPRGDG
jgi:hypothetical protein